ncbi:MAG: class I SAM-dependent methyltransferase [Actinomycetota bacterium]
MDNKNFRVDPVIYDLQVNWKARLQKEKNLFLGLVREKKIKRMLDIGCGTGHHVEFLSRYIPELVGMDPLGENIKYAEEKIVKSSKVKLINAGFEDLNNLDIGKFDLIISVGNTLPLLKTRRKVKLALKHMKKKLNAGGVAVLQFLNFNKKIVESNNYYRPKSIEYNGRRYISLKHFEYQRIKTKFDFLFIVLNMDGEVIDFFKNTSYLCTLRKNLFLKMAKNAGYKEISLLGPGGQGEFDEKKHVSLTALLHKSG